MGTVAEVSYHAYLYNPDDVWDSVAELREAINQYDPSIDLRHGENGAPSEYREFGALDGHDWTETSQAKWALRRMLGDRSRDIESSYFAIMDMQYPNEMNRKGLLYSNEDQTVGHRKEAYAAVQHLTAVFNGTLDRIPSQAIEVDTDRSVSVFGYEHRASGTQAVALWFDDTVPDDDIDTIPVDFTVYQGMFDEPVIVDLRTGDVSEIADDDYEASGTVYEFTSIPSYDSPVLVADRSLIPIDSDEE